MEGGVLSSNPSHLHGGCSGEQSPPTHSYTSAPRQGQPSAPLPASLEATCSWGCLYGTQTLCPWLSAGTVLGSDLQALISSGRNRNVGHGSPNTESDLLQRSRLCSIVGSLQSPFLSPSRRTLRHSGSAGLECSYKRGASSSKMPEPRAMYSVKKHIMGWRASSVVKTLAALTEDLGSVPCTPHDSSQT